MAYILQFGDNSLTIVKLIILWNLFQATSQQSGAPGDVGSRGPAGAQGPKGFRGPEGDNGDAGYRGRSGVKGSKGFGGVNGPPGQRVYTGPIGPPGPPGLPGGDGALVPNDPSSVEGAGRDLDCGRSGLYILNNQCLLCPLGTYSEGQNLDTCSPCPPGTTTRVEGSNSGLLCVDTSDDSPTKHETNLYIITGVLLATNAVALGVLACCRQLLQMHRGYGTALQENSKRLSGISVGDAASS